MSEEPNPALYAPAAERSVLGAVLLDERHLTTLVVDEHLRPEHFADRNLATIFEAAVKLQDEGRPVDHLTLAERLREDGQLERVGGERVIDELSSWVPATGHSREYGRLVRQRHRARELFTAAQRIQAEVLARSAPVDELLGRASERLDAIMRESHGNAKFSWTAEELRDEFFDSLGQPVGEVWPTPFDRLNGWLDGGLRRSELTLLGGFEKHGKSALVAGLLDGFAAQGLRVQLYINEMNRHTRMTRTIASLSGVSASVLRSRKLSPEQAKKVAEALPLARVGITQCYGWTAPEIARDIKRHRWDVACVDIAHNIPKTMPGTEGATLIAQEMRDVSLQAETLLLVVVHLNRNRAGESPILADIRDTGMWEKLADQVLFIHRDKDEFGMFKNTGALICAAAREGETGLMKVVFDPTRMRFLPEVSEDAVGVADPDRYFSQSREFVGDGGARF